MKTASGRKRYSREFKLEAVRLSNDPAKTVAEVARELGVKESDLHIWRDMVKKQGEAVFPGSGRKNDDMAALKRENLRLREECNILKKSAIYFAKQLKTGTDS